MSPSDPLLSPREGLQANVTRDVESDTQAPDQMLSDWGGSQTGRDAPHQRGVWVKMKRNSAEGQE